MKQREDIFDIAKAILIFYVVLCHVLNYANSSYDIIPYTLLQEFIASFHMAAFFILSGMLTNIEKWKKKSVFEFIIKKISSLIIPYLFFETVAILYEHFVLRPVNLKDAFINTLLLKPNVGANWFLPAMFTAMLIFEFYIKFPKKAFWISISIALPFVIMLIPQGYPWRLLVRALLAFEFLLIGNFLRKQIQTRKFSWAVTAFILTVACAAVNLKFSQGTDFYNGVLKNPLTCVVAGICGTYFVLYISKFFKFGFVKFFGMNSLIIMGTHQLILYTRSPSSSLFSVAEYMLIITAIEFVIIMVFNKIFPYFIGKKELFKQKS